MKKVLSQYVSEEREYVSSYNPYLSGAEVTDFQTINELIISAMENCLKILKNEKMDGGFLKCTIVNDPVLVVQKLYLSLNKKKVGVENNAKKRTAKGTEVLILSHRSI